MKVWLIGYTKIDFFDQPGLEEEVAPWYPGYDDDADTLAEFAGRACYQSWDRPNPATANNKDYLKHILEVNHQSVLEHNSYTFYCVGVSRTLTHELIRHRHLSFSELSQRYVDLAGYDTICPPDIVGKDTPGLTRTCSWAVVSAHNAYDMVMATLLGEGKKRKEARQAARAFLPAGMETKIVVSGNARAWRHVIEMRESPQADAEIQEFAREIHRKLLNHSPNLFQQLGE